MSNSSRYVPISTSQRLRTNLCYVTVLYRTCFSTFSFSLNLPIHRTYSKLIMFRSNSDLIHTIPGQMRLDFRQHVFVIPQLNADHAAEPLHVVSAEVQFECRITGNLLVLTEPSVGETVHFTEVHCIV